MKKKILLLGMDLLGWDKLKGNADTNKIELTDEQREMLNTAAKTKGFDAKFEELANEDLANQAALDDLQAQRNSTAQELADLLAENGIDDPELTVVDPSGDNAQVAKQVNKLRATMKDQNENIAKLSNEPEPDNPEFTHSNPNNQKMYNSTHLFASGKKWDAFGSDRPWNTRLRDHLEGKEVGASTYSTLDIDQLISDFNAWHDDDEAIVSFIRGLKRIPSNWGRISGVENEIWFAKLFLGEITQGRKRKFLAKGKFEFQPEKAKVYATQIDISFEGFELQKIEKTWLNRFNKVGSQPHKMSFIEMIMTEVYKKQLEEDDIAIMKGVYFPTEESDTPGYFLHRMNGFLKVVANARKDRKYLPFSLGKPTHSNIYDYVENFVKTVPKYWRDLPNMVLYMDIDFERAYHKKREQLKGTMPTYEPGKMTVDHYENIRIQPLYGVNDFMCITPGDNIDVLEGNPNEKSMFTAEKDKRDVNIMADYKIGTHVYAFGYQWPVGTTMTAEKQMFFSNDVDLLTDVTIPADVNATVLDATYHNAIQTGVNTQATAITNITNVANGETVYVYGNTGTASTIANAGNFDLASSITLGENTYIKLLKRASDGKFVEVLRGDTVEDNYVLLDADATTADATLGTHFLTQDNTGATAITNISGAEEGITYRIEGGSDTNATTIAKSGNFSRISAAITLEDGNWIDVIWNGSAFVETGRFVA